MFRSSKSSKVSKPSTAVAPVLTGPEKLAEVTRLLDKLSADLEKPCMLPHRETSDFDSDSSSADTKLDLSELSLSDDDEVQEHGTLTHVERDAALTQLKTYGSDPKDADPLFTSKGIETITRHALNSPSFTTSRIALRILANSMLLSPPTRAIFVSLHYELKLAQRLKNDNREDEFLVSRLIFLTTYGGNMDIENMIDNLHLGEIIVHNLARHAKQYEETHKMERTTTDRSSSSSIHAKLDEKQLKKEKKAAEKAAKEAKKKGIPADTGPDPMEDMALVETLKLFFNITYFCPSSIAALSPAVPHILRLILKRSVDDQNPMDPPMGQLMNALINLDLEANEVSFFPAKDPKAIAERFIHLLDLTTSAYEEKDLEKEASPILTVMRKIYAMAPQPVKLNMRCLLLPTEEDRAQPLGQSDTLSSRILRLSTSPVCPNARETLSNLLFEMSDKDAKNFVQNVGYGFASGFLFQNNVPIPENSIEAWSTSGSDGKVSMDGRSSMSSAAQGVPLQRTNTIGSTSGRIGGGSGLASSAGGMGGGAINPVTGQFFDKEKPVKNNMTREEKEREAERLMVLFDRLQKNGVITAEHPMRTMQQEGRFEELPDSDDEK